ncbi:MAG: FAD:protein FMN transferase [Jatrophihabitans sp.]|nr:MAG: FAD:protein FMN transferase [Jatrophihabitans sp.]
MSAPYRSDARSGRATLRAWSCTVRLVVGTPRVLRPAVADLTTVLARVDAVASRFRADSALSRANARAGRPVPVPRLLADLVAAALEAAAQTDGAVDPTLGRVLVALGYDRDIRRLPGDAAALAAVPPGPATWRAVRLDRTSGLLTVPAGTALDLGATAKAYVADHTAHALSRRYGTPVLLEIGGDVAVAGADPDGWCIEVAEREGEDGQLVLLRHGGLATSTTLARRWRRGGRELHHILDPRTHRPADGPWRTVSVHAPCALAANTASTAAIVLGYRALPWLEARNIAARLVAQDGTVVATGAWPRVPEPVRP